ncbi:hypothetical protein Uis1B_2106 [Bifidobacterium margollesii]|uniref:Uncharacterized protein n=1 Tax=Bifidobacterium margollesii TaxID=2020964 RepID=A0A2N5J768_9BIFI|nr:hypothetical protein [Bifidobacterium margollesii]PLS30055.1 hypothetical protein Uis1B_2106 [Bifidobacterium margollesii]
MSDRITVTFTAKDMQDTTIDEAVRRLETAGWKHVRIENLASSRPDRDRQRLADDLATALDGLDLTLTPSVNDVDEADMEDLLAIAGRLTGHEEES